MRPRSRAARGEPRHPADRQGAPGLAAADRGPQGHCAAPANAGEADRDLISQEQSDELGEGGIQPCSDGVLNAVMGIAREIMRHGGSGRVGGGLGPVFYSDEHLLDGRRRQDESLMPRSAEAVCLAQRVARDPCPGKIAIGRSGSDSRECWAAPSAFALRP